MAVTSFAIGDVRVNVLNPASLVERVRDMLQTGRGAAIATLNLDHVVKLRSDPAFSAAYAAQDLVTADGFPIVLAGRMRGADVVRTPGSELIQPLAALSAELGCGIALIGSSDDSLNKAAAELRRTHHGLRIVLSVSPAFGFDPTGVEADRIAMLLRESGARLCFLALGAPKQEILAARLRAFVPDVCVVSIGAGLDFISGHQVRAPHLLRQLNLEWAWRLSGNPRRLAGRYAASAAVLPRLLLAALVHRWA